LTESLATLMRWHTDGRIKPHISNILPLAETAEGLELLRSRKATGKVIITMP
ncbi:MAG: NADPH:quinone oxidoreductase family protein, partial [Rhodobacteraceae bacterium]|nr:NADPH:quinone oxidoreductase family protein [Paracoccaceae bacterium]